MARNYSNRHYNTSIVAIVATLVVLTGGIGYLLLTQNRNIDSAKASEITTQELEIISDQIQQQEEKIELSTQPAVDPESPQLEVTPTLPSENTIPNPQPEANIQTPATIPATDAVPNKPVGVAGNQTGTETIPTTPAKQPDIGTGVTEIRLEIRDPNLQVEVTNLDAEQ